MPNNSSKHLQSNYFWVMITHTSVDDHIHNLSTFLVSCVCIYIYMNFLLQHAWFLNMMINTAFVVCIISSMISRDDAQIHG